MANTFQFRENPPNSERRMHWRQKVFFTRVELGENNHGDILNISPSGLALQSEEQLNDDELPRMRFQLFQSPARIEAKGRIVWRDDSKKIAGVEFVDLSVETRKQILLSIFLMTDDSESPNASVPVEETEQISEATAISEPVSEFSFLDTAMVELIPEDQNHPSTFPLMQPRAETPDAETAPESAPAPNVTESSGVERFSEERDQQSTFSSLQSPPEWQHAERIPESEIAANMTDSPGVEQVPEEGNQESTFSFVQPPAEWKDVEWKDAQWHDAETVPESDIATNVTGSSGVELVPEERKQEPIFPSVQSPVESRDSRTVSDRALAPNVTGGSGKAGRLIGVVVVAVLLLLVFLPLRHYLQKAGTSQQGKEITAEPALPGPSSKTPAAPTSSAGPAPDHPVPTSRPGPSLGQPVFGLQVGAMVQEGNANALAKSLRQINFPALVSKRSNDRFYRVVVGPYRGEDAALRAKNELEKRGFKAFRTEWKPQAN
jgi:cell division septation protein DedD